MPDLQEMIAELQSIRDETEKLASRADHLTGELMTYAAGLGPRAEVALVRPDGRLSEAGVRYCNEAFEQGHGPSQVAKKLGVTVPAIVMRRQRWFEAKRNRRGNKSS